MLFRSCDFLIVHKRQADRTVEQIYWQTQHSEKKRPRTKLAATASVGMTLCIDTREKYAWKFGGAKTEKRTLSCGDYAIFEGEKLLAVVERKTLPNLLSEFGKMDRFHQSLWELEIQPRAVLVIEADYSDLLNTEKVAPYTPEFCAKAIGQLQSLHAKLPSGFADTR